MLGGQTEQLPESFVELDVKRSNVYTLHNTMNQRIATYVIIAASFMGIGGQAVIYFTDKATAHQCINHDWPKEHDTLHRNWCITNGYDI